MRPESAEHRNGRSRAPRWTVLLAVTTLLAMAAAVSAGWAAKPSQGPAMAADEREVFMEVRAIASMLRAPCCPNLTVSKHNSPVTLKMKKDIEAMVRKGMGRSEIISVLKAEYGDQIAPSVIPALWKPYLYIGGPILGLLILAILGRWLFRHEKSPTVLHMVEESGGDSGSRSHAA